MTTGGDDLQRVVASFASLLQPIQGGDSLYGNVCETQTKSFESTFHSHPPWTSHGDDSETVDLASDAGPSLSGCSDGYTSSSSSSPEAVTVMPGLAAKRAFAHQKLPPYQPDLCHVDEQLVDLDMNEGRRRGDLLFAMIKPAPQDKHGEKAAPPPPPPWPPVSEYRGLTSSRRFPPSCAPAPGLAYPTGFAPASSQGYSRVEALVREAVRLAFGVHAADVTRSAAADGGQSSAFIVQLLSDQYGVPRAKLDAFCRELRSSIGRDVVSFEQNTRGASSTMCLTLRNQGEDACWDFARRGICPRGYRCKWPHHAETISIEVLA